MQEKSNLKGTTWDKVNKKWKAQIYINGAMRGLGQYKDRLQAIKRFEAATEAINNGMSLYTFLRQNPNVKHFESSVPVFENEYNAFVKDEDREPSSKDGYHFELGFHFTNLNVLQKRYEEELKGKEAIKKEVLFFDFAPNLFRSKKIQFKYWQSHLGDIGKDMTYCNHDMTAEEIKNALMKVFFRNIWMSKAMQPEPVDYQTFWLAIGSQLDEIVLESIYGTPDRKPKKVNKFFFNCDVPRGQRPKIIGTYNGIERANKDGALGKLKKNYKPDSTKKGLSKETGISLYKVKKYWNQLEAA